MKKTGFFIIVYLCSIFILTSFLSAQIRVPSSTANDLAGLVKVTGWVHYGNGNGIGSTSSLDSEMDVELIDNSKYEIVVLKINGIKYRYQPTIYDGDYDLWVGDFNVNVGDMLVLKVGLREKGKFLLRKSIKYYTVAKFRIKNLYKKFVFPSPDQVINLDLYRTNSITFRWKFTNFVQKSNISIAAQYGGKIYKTATGESCSISKSDLAYDKKYTLNIGAYGKIGKKTNFTFTKFVSKRSKVNFSHSYAIYFKTKKRLLIKQKITIK